MKQKYTAATKSYTLTEISERYYVVVFIHLLFYSHKHCSNIMQNLYLHIYKYSSNITHFFTRDQVMKLICKKANDNAHWYYLFINYTVLGRQVLMLQFLEKSALCCISLEFQLIFQVSSFPISFRTHFLSLTHSSLLCKRLQLTLHI